MVSGFELLDGRAHADELRHMIRAGRTPRLRTIREFAEAEIVLPPTGPKPNRHFSCEFQPYTALWFDAIASGIFNRYAATGPSQSGKTLSCFVLPIMWHLFERRENVIAFAPNMDICEDKFLIDLLPTIEKSRYIECFPRRGGGSKKGFDELIRFSNGTYLKFMTAGGGDKNKAAITAKVACGTEVDGMAEGVSTSVETSPLNQIAARLRSHGSRARMYIECTVSTKTGIIWQEFTNGTASRIVLPCPHCSEFVCPERENFIGWETATSEIEAEAQGRFYCPSCGGGWTHAQREEANRHCKIIHKGQTITPDGVVTGAIPPTRTFGFRWSAVNNNFAEESQLGLEEWKAERNPNREDAEKERCQFVWCIPVEETVVDEVPLEISAIIERTHEYPRGIVPPGCDSLAVGLDIGGWWCYWTAMAFRESDGHGFIIDYDRIHVAQAELGLEAGLMEAMRDFRSMCLKGWQQSEGGVLVPEENLIDSGWKTPIVYTFIQETGLPFRPTKGLSVSGEVVSYTRPKSTGSIVRWIGDGWHISRLKEHGIDLLEIDANEAKSTLHSRLTSDIEAPGAVTLFQIDRADRVAVEERRRYARHLTAEKSQQEFVPGRGTITTWKKIRRDNHHLDSTALAIVGGSLSGVMVIEAKETETPAPTPPKIETKVRRGSVRKAGWLSKGG